MKLNWKTLKIAFAFVIVIGAVFWAVSSVRTHSYAGANLNFGVGGGPVMVTNPSEQPVPVQLVSTGSRTFSISSTIEGVSGSSTRQGSGSGATQLFEFELPTGNSEFTITRGTNVNFVANTETRLQTTVNPVSSDTFRTIIIVAAIVILGALFYASHVTKHRWMQTLRRNNTPTQDTQPIAATAAIRQGSAPHSYGDNRANTGD
jgi:preprotein translocase subunit SecE